MCVFCTRDHPLTPSPAREHWSQRSTCPFPSLRWRVCTPAIDGISFCRIVALLLALCVSVRCFAIVRHSIVQADVILDKRLTVNLSEKYNSAIFSRCSILPHPPTTHHSLLWSVGFVVERWPPCTEAHTSACYHPLTDRRVVIGSPLLSRGDMNRYLSGKVGGVDFLHCNVVNLIIVNVLLYFLVYNN